MRNRAVLALSFVAAFAGACANDVEGDDGLALDGDSSDEAAIAPSPFYAGDGDAVFGLDISFWEGPVAEQEMDCFWESGVRHIVSGTQLEEVTRQQLAMAVKRGMTVDAYVYLYWNEDMAQQVDRAFSFTTGFPIGRMWLDVEEPPAGLGANAVIDRVQQSLDRCRSDAHGVECGIYTGAGFWHDAMNNTERFADVPLWYARYDGGRDVAKRALSSWSTDRFGGWAAPEGKQWAEQALCGYGPDEDTLRVVTTPTVVVDRSVPPDDGQAPAAPVGLEPQAGTVTALDYVKLSVTPIARATRYELALETYDGATWQPYYTWRTPNAFRKVSPAFHDAAVRFRARATNAHGTGPWSSWSTFAYGNATIPDDTAPPAPPPASSPAGVPAALAPDGTTITSESVTLSCGAVGGATRYSFAVSTVDANGTHPYYTYVKSAPSATFWPQVHGTYSFTVRADDGAWSAPATFNVQ